MAEEKEESKEVAEKAHHDSECEEGNASEEIEINEDDLLKTKNQLSEY